MSAAPPQGGLTQALGAATARVAAVNAMYYSAFTPAGGRLMSVTTIRLQPEVESGLEAMSDKLHRSKNWLINQAIREFVARQELEQSRWKETLTAMESVAEGKVVSGEAVHSWLESWGSSNELSPPQADK